MSDNDVREMWRYYLLGQYDACLRVVSPENLVEKDFLIGGITSLLNDPKPDNPLWRRSLASLVEKLDELERPFCEYDRRFFGGPVSRDTYITDVRAHYAL